MSQQYFDYSELSVSAKRTAFNIFAKQNRENDFKTTGNPESAMQEYGPVFDKKGHIMKPLPDLKQIVTGFVDGVTVEKMPLEKVNEMVKQKSETVNLELKVSTVSLQNAISQLQSVLAAPVTIPELLERKQKEFQRLHSCRLRSMMLLRDIAEAFPLFFDPLPPEIFFDFKSELVSVIMPQHRSYRIEILRQHEHAPIRPVYSIAGTFTARDDFFKSLAAYIPHEKG